MQPYLDRLTRLEIDIDFEEQRSPSSRREQENAQQIKFELVRGQRKLNGDIRKLENPESDHLLSKEDVEGYMALIEKCGSYLKEKREKTAKANLAQETDTKPTRQSKKGRWR